MKRYTFLHKHLSREGLTLKAVAEQLIAETPLIEEIEHIHVELGHDFTGDPALWLIFRLAPRRKASARIDWKEARRLNDYAAVLQRRFSIVTCSVFPLPGGKEQLESLARLARTCLPALVHQDPFFPQDAILRRAVSASSYSIFHMINADAVALLAPNVSIEVNHRI